MQLVNAIVKKLHPQVFLPPDSDEDTSSDYANFLYGIGINEELMRLGKVESTKRFQVIQGWCRVW